MSIRSLVPAFVVLFFVACAAPAPTPTENPAPTAEPTEALSEDEAEPTQNTIENAALVMNTLSDGATEEVYASVDAILAAEDERFIPVLIELLHADLIGYSSRRGAPERLAALEELSGQNFGQNWADWIVWYGTTDIEPPPGYLEWKALLLSRIDIRFASLLSGEVDPSLRPEEIVWGGVVVDGIPALDQAEMIDPAEADYLEPDEPVFGLVINGDARAYPLRIMDWHEMANDVVGGVPVSIAYCTLCGSAIAYAGEASNGNVYDFGSSGFLYRSNKLMYDRQTETLWNQLTGEPVLGELVGTGVELEILPLVLTSFADWQAQHPDTQVLSIDTGFDRPYELGAAYGDYFASEATMFPVWQRSDLLPDKSQVFALRIDGAPKAYPLETLLAERVVNDELAGQPVVVVASGDTVTVSGVSSSAGQFDPLAATDVTLSYDVGAAVRAYERGEVTFSAGEDDATLLDEEGNSWQVTPEALVGPDDQRLERLGGHLAYWFGWFSFFPNTDVYGVEQ